MTRQAIAVWEDEFAKKLDVDIFANSPDFDPPIYNIWKQDIPPHARGTDILFWSGTNWSRIPPHARGTDTSGLCRPEVNQHPPTRAGAHKQDGTVPFTRTAAASAIRRYGELLKQIEPDKGGYHGNYAHDGTDTRITRTEAATQAGISERQKVTARSFQTRQTPCPQHRGNPRVPAPENLPGLLSQHRCSGLPASAP